MFFTLAIFFLSCHAFHSFKITVSVLFCQNDSGSILLIFQIQECQEFKVFVSEHAVQLN